MRLISLTANKKTFRPIHFNQTGLTLVLGKQKSPEALAKGKTYNGVGKSLVIALIHYCLGSNKNAEFERAIPGWEFCLQFELGGERFIARRSTSDQKRIYLNDEELGVRKFCEILFTKGFQIDKARPGLTFRALLSRFVRPKKSGYVAFDAPQPQETPYQRLLANGFLLGLDMNLIEKKHDLYVAREKIKEFRKNLERDTVFREFFSGFRDVEIELHDLDEKIEQLEGDLSEFRVAENYSEMQNEANALRRDLQQVRNNLVTLENAVHNIDQSLEIKVDISVDRVVQLYSETETHMPDATVKRVQEVIDFHKSLMTNRIEHLRSERARLEAQGSEVRESIRNLSKRLDEQLRFLGEHGALDEFVEMSNLLGELRSRAAKLRDYKELLARYGEQVREINVELIEETEKASKYLEQAHELLESNLSAFRSYSRRFYPDKPGGLTVKNNEGENQIRFDVNAKIQDDASDGINEVKIFCFDMTLLTRRHRHAMNCIFHDSRLFSDIDPRQRATLFRIAQEESEKLGVQYIATVNEDQIWSMREQFSDDEFSNIFDRNIVLELTDESPSAKLLGIQVDMHYE